MDRYIFTPVGFETLGSWRTEACSLVKQIGKKWQDQSGEQRATCFSVQKKISIESQRGNAFSVLGTFPYSRRLDDIFNILKTE